MIIPLQSSHRQRSSRLTEVPHPPEVWAFIGDFGVFSLLYGEADAPDAPACFAGELFGVLANHRDKSVRGSNIAIWTDVMPLDVRRWMFFVTARSFSEDLLAALELLASGTNGWSTVGRVPVVPQSAIPMFEYADGENFLLLSDVMIGVEKEALAHPVVNYGKAGLSLAFGVFPAGYIDENRLYFGAGGGICFRTRTASALRPGEVYCLLAEEQETSSSEEPSRGGLGNGV